MRALLNSLLLCRFLPFPPSGRFCARDDREHDTNKTLPPHPTPLINIYIYSVVPNQRQVVVAKIQLRAKLDNWALKQCSTDKTWWWRAFLPPRTRTLLCCCYHSTNSSSQKINEFNKSSSSSSSSCFKLESFARFGIGGDDSKVVAHCNLSCVF